MLCRYAPASDLTVLVISSSPPVAPARLSIEYLGHPTVTLLPALYSCCPVGGCARVQKQLGAAPFDELTATTKMDYLIRLALLYEVEWLDLDGAKEAMMNVEKGRFTADHYVKKYFDKFLYSGFKLEPRYTSLVLRDRIDDAKREQVRREEELLDGDRQAVSEFQGKAIDALHSPYKENIRNYVYHPGMYVLVQVYNHCYGAAACALHRRRALEDYTYGAARRPREKGCARRAN